jgi:hypothetical protein
MSLDKVDFNKLRVDAEVIICEKLRDSPLGIVQIIKLLEQNEIPHSIRIAKEVAWSMSENGTARFNDDWLLELVD